MTVESLYDKMMKIAGATALTLGAVAAKEIPDALKEEFMMPTRDGVRIHR